MTSAPTQDQILRLVQFGCLHLEPHARGLSFVLHNDDLEISGPVIVRPDWSDGPDDRPGLMPVIERIEAEGTAVSVDAHRDTIGGLSQLHAALRQRLSPERIFRRHDGRWMLVTGTVPEHA